MDNSVKTEDNRSYIDVRQNEKFEGDMKTMITSSIEVSDLISNFFGTIFNDYRGCKVCINDGSSAFPNVATSMPFGALYVDLYFKYSGNDKVKPGTVKSVWKSNVPESVMNSNKSYDSETPEKNNSEKKPVSISDRYMQMVHSNSNSRSFVINKPTYDILSKYVATGSNTRWIERTHEIISGNVYGKDEIVICISGIDLNALISDIYGEKGSDSKYEYCATPAAQIPYKTSEFVILICQLKTEAIRQLQETLGIYQGNPIQYHQYNG